MTNSVRHPPSTGGTILKALEGGGRHTAPTRRGQGGPKSEAFANLLVRGEPTTRPAVSGDGPTRARSRAIDGTQVAKGQAAEIPSVQVDGTTRRLDRKSIKAGLEEEAGATMPPADATGAPPASVPDATRLDGGQPVAVIQPVTTVMPLETIAPMRLGAAETVARTLDAAGDLERVAIDPKLEVTLTRDAAVPEQAAAVVVAMRAANVVVERVETHHAPSLALEGLRDLTRLQSRQSQSEQPAATGAAPVEDSIDVAAPRGPDDRASAEPHDGSGSADGRPKLDQRWRPDHRGDMFSSAGSRRGWDAVAPARNAVASDAVRQETFQVRDATVQSGLVGPAIGNGLLAAIKEAAITEAASSLADVGSQPHVPSGLPVKSLELTMQPGQLGPVEVRMRLENGALTISMKAANREDAAALAIERDAIEETLRSNGHSIDAITVSIAGEPVVRSDPLAPPTPTQQQQSGSGFADSRAQTASTGGGERDGRGAGGHDGAAGRRSENSSAAAAARPAPRSGIYV